MSKTSSVSSLLLKKEFEKPLKTFIRHVLNNPEPSMLIYLGIFSSTNDIEVKYSAIQWLSHFMPQNILVDNELVPLFIVTYKSILFSIGFMTLFYYWWPLNSITFRPYIVLSIVSTVTLILNGILLVLVTDWVHLILTILFVLTGSFVRLRWIKYLEEI